MTTHGIRTYVRRMMMRSMLLRDLARTSQTDWLTDARLEEMDADPLTVRQRTAIGRILNEMARAAEDDAERRTERRAADALSFLTNVAQWPVDPATAERTLQAIITEARVIAGTPLR